MASLSISGPKLPAPSSRITRSPREAAPERETDIPGSMIARRRGASSHSRTRTPLRSRSEYRSGISGCGETAVRIACTDAPGRSVGAARTDAGRGISATVHPLLDKTARACAAGRAFARVNRALLDRPRDAPDLSITSPLSTGRGARCVMMGTDRRDRGQRHTRGGQGSRGDSERIPECAKASPTATRSEIDGFPPTRQLGGGRPQRLSLLCVNNVPVPDRREAVSRTSDESLCRATDAPQRPGPWRWAVQSRAEAAWGGPAPRSPRLEAQ